MRIRTGQQRVEPEAGQRGVGVQAAGLDAEHPGDQHVRRSAIRRDGLVGIECADAGPGRGLRAGAVGGGFDQAGEERDAGERGEGLGDGRRVELEHSGGGDAAAQQRVERLEALGRGQPADRLDGPLGGQADLAPRCPS